MIHMLLHHFSEKLFHSLVKLTLHRLSDNEFKGIGQAIGLCLSLDGQLVLDIVALDLIVGRDHRLLLLTTSIH